MRSRWIVRLFALAGLGVSGYASFVHYKLLTDPTYISPCDINTVFNCSQVYLSPYGSVRGVPVAVGGVIWFALVSLLAWLGPVAATSAPAPMRVAAPGRGRQPETTEPRPGAAETIDGYLFALATIGLAAILYLGFASYRLHHICVLCAATYVCVLGIFITTALTTTARVAVLPLRLLEDLRHMTAKPFASVVTVLFLAGAASVVAFFPKEGAIAKAAQTPGAPLSNDAESQFRAAWAAQPRKDLGIPSDGAKVVVVKFNDWLCPSCKFFHQAYKPTLDRYATEQPGAIKYVVKDWLWNSRCNPFTQSISGHEGACEAAASVRMARDRGKANEMIDWLFENQQRLVQLGIGSADPKSASNPASIAIKEQAIKMLGLTDATFDHEYNLKLADIRRDESDGMAVGVTGTPTYFVNGVRAEANGGALPVQYFEMALKIELEKPNPGGK